MSDFEGEELLLTARELVQVASLSDLIRWVRSIVCCTFNFLKVFFFFKLLLFFQPNQTNTSQHLLSMRLGSTFCVSTVFFFFFLSGNV